MRMSHVWKLFPDQSFESFLELTTPLPAKQITISLLPPLLRKFLSTSIIAVKMAS